MSEYSFDLIADYWSVYLGKELTDQDVAYLLTLFKLARYQRTGKEDHAFDLEKYAEHAYYQHGPSEEECIMKMDKDVLDFLNGEEEHF